jgi:tetratricopeptide (TPR) repeat protein
MKKFVLILVGLLLCLGKVALAGLKEADDLYNQKKYDEALVEYRKVLPELAGQEASYCQLRIGHCLELQKKYDEAITEFKKVLVIPEASPYNMAYAQYCVGRCLMTQKKYGEAITEFKKVSAIQGASPFHIAGAEYSIGYCLEMQGKYDEAQQHYLAVCRQEGAGLYWYKIAFSKINKTKLGRDGYIKLLQDMIFIIPATQENAEFLGLLKSELKKLGVE